MSIIGKVYNVQRYPKTAKAINVGDYETLEQAEAAMLKHYQTTPKRGAFYYRISQDTLEDIGGVVMRSFTVSLRDGTGSYYKRYTADALKEMPFNN